ncbi:MAG: 3-carboxyethylcatechol 2,3-dioxygenase [Immundisolibacter sp.]
MPVAALFASHTPLKDYLDPGPGVAAEVADVLDQARAFVRAFAPDVVIEFAPDHFNGFFYRLMPSFCIGAAAESIGDWKTRAGPLNVEAALATQLVQAAHADGVDVALSHRMQADHGFTQLLEILFDPGTAPPLVPVFINCAAPPRPPMARVLALGQAVGRFAAASRQRVLLLASGGLSHDPPVPLLDDAPPAVRERLIAGGRLSPEARAAREDAVLREGQRFASASSARTPLNPDWDRAFLDALEAGRLGHLAALDDTDITRAAGAGGHEVRTWLAAAAALAAAGPYRARRLYYRPIDSWIAGFGVVTAQPA